MSGVDFDQVQFGRTTITYEITRSRRRQTVGITVNPDATVTAVAPSGVWRRRIRQIVQDKAAWVVEKQDAVARHGRPCPRQLVSGESLPYLGRNYQLKIVQLRRREVTPSVRMERGQLRVEVARHWGADRKREAVREVLRQWYRDHAFEHVEAIAERFSRRLGVTYKSLQIYEMKTRWGSGGTSGRLRFNWRIIMAPRRLVEYVVAHELCHLRHNDHSAPFWRMLATAIPDYEQRRVELAHRGPRLDL